MKRIFMMLSLFSSCTFAGTVLEGHAVGNGGGVICIRGKCVTLQEAGLSMSPEYSGVWIPQAEHFKLVDQHIEAEISLPREIKSSLNYNTFARVDEFRKVEIVDPARVEAIRQQYIDAAKKAGTTIDPKTFEVVAISSDETVQPAQTFLLPKFFELTADRQARTLFHEGLYRGKPSGILSYILQFESAIYKGATIDQAILAYRLGLLNKAQLIGAIFYFVHGSRSGSSLIYLSEFGEIDTNGAHPMLKLDPRQLLFLAQFEPRLPYMFSKIDSIALKLKSKSAGGYNYGSPVIAVDWIGRSAPVIENFVIDGSGAAQAEDYEFADPESIDLILPE